MMPLQRCKVGGQLGWRWGQSGKCYVGKGGRARAIQQMKAILATGWTENFNPHHDSEGKFASGGGAAVMSVAGPEEYERLRSEATASFPEGPQRDEALAALTPSKWDSVVVARRDDRLVGVVSFWRDPDTANEEGVPYGRYLRIRNMASSEKGVGRQLVNTVKEKARSTRAGVYLSSLSQAEGFWEKMGFERATGATYYLTADQLGKSVQNVAMRQRAPNPLRMDPTRAATLRRRFSQDIVRRLVAVGYDVVKLIVEEDAFGLGRRSKNPMVGVGGLIPNYDPSQPRDKEGRWSRVGTGSLEEDFGFVKLYDKEGKQVWPPESAAVQTVAEEPKSVAVELPDPNTVHVLKNLPGSTGPKLVEDGQGRKWVMKKSKGKEEQLRNEEDACAAYRTVGAAVPNGGLVESGGSTVKFSEYLESGVTLGDWKYGKSKPEIDAMHQQIGKHFAADALFANWDVAGLDNDNLLIVSGRPYRIDNGGALLFRAQGAPKGSAFGPKVTELQTLRDHSKNPNTSRIFAHLTEKDIKGQINELAAKRGQILGAIQNPKTREIVSQRLDYMVGFAANLAANTRFMFHSTPQQVEAFRAWLATRIALTVLGGATPQSLDDAWWQAYVMDGFMKGAARAFDDTKKLRKESEWTAAEQAFYAGTKEEFLRSSFAHPVSIEKAKLLAGRVYTELKGITDDMAKKMAQTLTDGLVQGQSPREVARGMVKVIEIAKPRALTIARTETTRAHAEGQLAALEKLGVTQLGVAVEWSTSGLGITAKGNPSPCKVCAPLAGVVFSLEEARGLIPRHPNCICAFVPANVGEDHKGQKRSAKQVEAAVLRSVKAGQPKNKKKSKGLSWAGSGLKIAKKRPKAMV